MKRLYCTLMIALLMVTLAAGPGQSADQAPKKVMKLAGTAPANKGVGEYDAMLKFEELVEKYSNGSIDVQVFPAAQLGGGPELTEGVALGTIEAGVGGFDGIAPLKQDLFALSLPYQFTEFAQMRKVLEGDTKTRRMTDAYLGEINLKLVAFLYRPFRSVANNVRPIRSPEDLKGVKVRSPDSAVFLATIDALGANPMVQAWAELYTSLAQGTLDGCENAITEIVSVNFQEVTKYISETRHMAAAIPLFVGLDWFNGLTEEQRDAILRAGGETTQWRFEQVQNEEKIAWQKCRDSKVQIIAYEELDLAPFQKATAGIYKQFMDRGLFTQEYYEQIMSDAGLR